MVAIRKLQRMSRDAALRRAGRQLEALEQQLPLDRAEKLYMRDLLTWLAGEVPEVDCTQLQSFLASGGAVESETLFRIELNAARHKLLQLLGMEPAEWDLQPRIHLPSAGCSGLSPLSGMRLYVDGVRSPFNLGSIMRTAVAMGVYGLLCSPETVSADHPRAVRSAMGAMPRWRIMDYDELRDCGLPLIALETGGVLISEYTPPRDCVLVLGSEELGIHPELLAAADERISIPLWGPKASLNVGVAAGAALSTLAVSLSRANG